MMTAQAKDRYIANFRNVETSLPGHAVSSVKRIRREALEIFANKGFPSTHDEEWKYTNLSALQNRAFTPAIPGAYSLNQTQLSDWLFANMETYLLVFVDGFFVPALSRIDLLQKGVVVSNTAKLISQHSELFTQSFPENTEANVFGFLNTAFATDGVYAHVPAGIEIDRPIHLLFVACAPESCSHPRNMVVVEDNAKVSLIEHYVSANDAGYFTNAVTTIEIGNNARVDHYKLQQESGKAFHIAGIYAKQKRDSIYNTHSLAIGGLLSRNDIKTQFLDIGGGCQLNGLYIASDRQHVDHHTTIDHAVPQCVSRENYRGVLSGAARAVFNGKVIVHQDAQKTDAQQANHNLLLSSDAEVDTKPELQIYADDVKCAHGATVGQIDDDMLFYFRSRGISKDIAYGLLTYAFAHDIVERIELKPLREQVERVLMAQLPQGAEIKELI